MRSTPAALVSRLTALSGSGDAPAREQAILASLADPAPAVREVAVAWAARCLEPAVLVPLVAEAKDATLRNAALAALERQGPYAVTCVERMTASADADVAMFACQVLGGIGGVSSTRPLLTALLRPEVNVTQAAAEALGRLRRREAVPALMALLRREPWLQLAAADALGAIGDPTPVPALLALVPDSFVAEPALEALRRIAAPEALPRLLELLLDPAQTRLRSPLLRAIGAILDVVRPLPDLREAGREIERDHGTGSLWAFLTERLGAAEDGTLGLSAGDSSDDRSRARGGGVNLRSAGALVFSAGLSSLFPLVLRWAEDRDAQQWLVPLGREVAGRRAGALAALLDHPDPSVRAGALRSLFPTLLGGDRLVAALQDPSRLVRIAACDALAEHPDPRAADLLSERLAVDHAPERLAAVRALARCPAEVVATRLAGWLEAGAPQVATVAALQVLAETRCPALDERLLELVQAATELVRRTALRAAARVPGARAEVLLLRALADHDAGLQEEALDLLVERRGSRTSATLLALLGTGDSLRYHVIRALGRLGRPEAVAPLTSLYSQVLLHERLEIVTALARIGGPEVRPFLLDCLDTGEPEVRRVAASGLADLAGPDDLDLLHRLAADADWVLRSEAARALGRLGLPAARPTLLDLVRDLEPAVARSARAALAAQ